MPTRRQIQVADEIQQIVSQLLLRELKDPRFGFATITQVEVTGDFKYARIFVSVMGTQQEQRDTMAAFNSGRGFIRREIASRMRMRSVPEIQFKLDTSAEYSDRINRLLNEIKESDAARQLQEPLGEAAESEESAEKSDNEAAVAPDKESE